DVEAVRICRRLLSFLPSHNLEDPPRVEPDDEGLYNPELNEIVPEDAKVGYDVRDVIARLVDRADFLEVHSEFARNVVVGFGRGRDYLPSRTGAGGRSRSQTNRTHPRVSRDVLYTVRGGRTGLG